LKTASIKARPFVWSLGGHAVLFALLVAGSARHRGSEGGGAEAGRSLRFVEATLASSEAEQPKVVPESPSQATPFAAQAPATSTSEDERTAADHPVSQPPSAGPRPSVADARPMTPPSATRSESAAGLAAGSGESSPDPDADPYAEMRRQRAEAERTYQLQQAAARGGQALGAQTSGAAPADGTKPVAPPAGVDFPPLSTSPYSTDAALFASDAACDAARTGTTPAASTAWMDCLFRSAAAQWLDVGPPRSAWSLALHSAPVLPEDESP